MRGDQGKPGVGDAFWLRLAIDKIWYVLSQEPVTKGGWGESIFSDVVSVFLPPVFQFIEVAGVCMLCLSYPVR